MERLRQQFLNDLASAGLSLVSVPPTELPDTEILESMVCPQLREENRDDP